MSLIDKIFKVFDPEDRKRFILLFFLMLVSAAMEVIGIGSVPIVVRYILEPQKLNDIPWLYNLLQKQNWLDTQSLFIIGSALIVAIFVLKNLYKVFVEFNQLKLVKDIQVRLSTKLFEKYLRSEYKFYLKRSTSVLIRNIQNEVSYITTKVLIPLFLILLNGVILTAIFTSMIVVEAKLTLLVVSILIIAMSTFNLIVRRRLKQYGKVLQKERRNQLQYLYQGLQGFKVIKVSNTENFFLGLFKRTTTNFAKTQLKTNTIGKLPAGYLEIVAIVAILVLVGGMLSMGYQGNKLTYLVSFFGLALIRMRQNFSTIMVNLNLVRTNEVSFDPVLKDLGLKGKRKPTELSHGVSESLLLDDNISFKKVSFKYEDNECNTLNDITFEIKKGNIIGIAGATGGGKTTLVDLILGLHKPTSGKIEIDGVEINRVLPAWQKQIGYVPQHIYLLDDTIAANIAFGINNDQIDIAQIEKVIEAAQLNNFINSLPQGINTQVGENGVRLSGGQRQRIGIARALYRNPQVLILDEATSALDNETEKKFVDLLYTLDKSLTIIMIAHRLTTLEKCDRILFLKSGEVGHEGTFEELMAQSEAFNQMAQG